MTCDIGAPLRLLVLAVPLALAPFAAAAQEASWQSALTDQMMQEYDCAVAAFTEVSERVVNGEQVVIAKVHCVDLRSFDAYRDSAFEPFEIHPCDNPDNRVC